MITINKNFIWKDTDWVSNFVSGSINSVYAIALMGKGIFSEICKCNICHLIKRKIRKGLRSMSAMPDESLYLIYGFA